MITLGYRLSPAWNRRAETVDLRTASETQLRYDCFLGDVLFRIDAMDLSANWGWVPVLDFALSLRAVARMSAVDGRQQLEFTESDATITFDRVGEVVRVHANYATGGADVMFAELSAAAEELLARMLRELCRAHAPLGDNPLIADVMPQR